MVNKSRLTTWKTSAICCFNGQTRGQEIILCRRLLDGRTTGNGNVDVLLVRVAANHSRSCRPIIGLQSIPTSWNGSSRSVPQPAPVPTTNGKRITLPRQHAFISELSSFLEGPKAALLASKDYDNGHYTTSPQVGIRAFARVYSAWAYGQAVGSNR